jgi:alkanesulfonate monooxygenase SsuD/methylene tetrahydromethanopterin reductase-like flavin-dependent oxidoreductase (luciferase family)
MLGVGLGFSGEAEFARFGEDGNARVRADKLDEALAIIDGLCRGEPFSYEGKHYSLTETTFTPRPVQERIPIWVAGYWPNKRPFRRAARWDGTAPVEMDIRPDDFSILPSSPRTIKDIKAYIDQHRTSNGPYDIVVSHVLPDEPEEASATIRAFEEAGVTWLLRDMLPWEVSLDEAYEIVRAGPPDL